MNNCLHCGSEIESDDNFCPICGHWTPRGYIFLKNQDNIKTLTNGETVKQTERLSIFICLLIVGLLLFIIMMFIRGEDLFKPFIYLKKQATNYIYGYNTSLIKTDNKYTNETINTYEEAIEIIVNDFDKQSWLCDNNIDVSIIENELEEKFSIPSISFCDASYSITSKINNVINRMYDLFPNIEGALTNITITNANPSNEYIAYFQPLYQFVNIDEDINEYNKVNKTQILLNSYYFLNEDILESKIEDVVGENWYVSDATWESTIAHELGHYISFVTLLKENNLSNITFETLNNQEQIKKLIEEFNNGTYSDRIVNEAILNFNSKYNLNYDIETFALTISKYASTKDSNNNIIRDELIAEAIHDYYLHGLDMKNTSKEIINVIKNKL